MMKKYIRYGFLSVLVFGLVMSSGVLRADQNVYGHSYGSNVARESAEAEQNRQTRALQEQIQNQQYQIQRLNEQPHPYWAQHGAIHE